MDRSTVNDIVLAIGTVGSLVIASMALNRTCAGDRRDGEVLLEEAWSVMTGGGSDVFIRDLSRSPREVGSALSKIEEAWDLGPEKSELHRALGVYHYLVGNSVTAVDNLKRAVDADPRNVEATITLALVLGETGDEEGAENVLNGLKGTAEEHPLVVYYTAWDAYERGNFEEAANSVRQAMNTAPRVPELHLALGVFEAARGDLAKARQALDDAAKLDPERVEVYLNRGQVLWELGEAQGSKKDYELALKLDPESAEAAEGFARAATRLAEESWEASDPSGALELLEEALHADPRHLRALIDQADYLRNLDRLQDAAESYRSALAVEGDNRWVIRWLQEIEGSGLRAPVH